MNYHLVGYKSSTKEHSSEFFSGGELGREALVQEWASLLFRNVTSAEFGKSVFFIIIYKDKYCLWDEWNQEGEACAIWPPKDATPKQIEECDELEKILRYEIFSIHADTIAFAQDKIRNYNKTLSAEIKVRKDEIDARTKEND